MGQIGAAIFGSVLHGTTSPLGDPISNTTKQALNGQYPTALPSIPELLWAYRSGWLSASKCKSFLRCNGVDWRPVAGETFAGGQAGASNVQDAWARVYNSQAPQPALGELLQLVNRQILPYAAADLSLLRQGFSTPQAREALLALRNEIPGPGDLVRFAIRHVFEPSLTREFGFAAEMPQDFLAWHEKQGFGYPVNITDPITQERSTITWAQAHWMAHWVWPSPGQGYQFLQRLRPSGGRNGGPRDPSGVVFTANQLRLLLRGNDYAPIFRPALTAISYRVLGIRPIAQMFAAKLIDRKEAVEMYLDLGYNQRDAELYASLTEIRATKAEKLKAVQGVRGKLLRAYKVGVVSRSQTAPPLYRLSLTDPQKAADFAKLPPAQQEQTALADPDTAQALDAVDLDQRLGLIEAQIRSARRYYEKGRLNKAQTQGRLIALGLQPARVTEYLDHWEIALTHDKRELAAAQILKAMRFGIIAEQVARNRLANLGWDNDDVNVQVGLTRRDIALDLARAQAQAARTEEQRKRALEAAARAAAAAHRQARAELARYGSRADLVRWFTHGLIDQATLEKRLALLDLTPHRVDTVVAEAMQKRQDWLQKQAGKKNGKPAVNGGPAAGG